MKSYKKLRTNLDNGFTLIELLVVIIIIGILAGIAVIGVSGAQKAAVSKACTANSVQIGKAIRTYYAAKGVFPTKATVGLVTDTQPLYYSDTDLKFLWGATGGTTAPVTNEKFLENAIPELTPSATNKYTLYAVVDANGAITVSSVATNGSYATSLTTPFCPAVTG